MSYSKTLLRPMLFILILLLAAPAAWSQSLRPSRSSLNRQNEVARQHDYTFLRDSRQLRHFVRKGWLVPVRPNDDFRLASVRYPYARPEVKLFIERLSSQYRDACGERLVVTSLTRPRSYRPSNSSRRSVHPTGMAIDLRRPKSRACRSWLESTLLSLEGQRVLEVSVERYPPHYHLALFPRQYKAYVDRLTSGEESTTRLASTSRSIVKVRPGDTLWTIARRHQTTVGRLKAINGLRGELIKPGQSLRVR